MGEPPAYRVASGIVAIVLGFWLLMGFLGGASASSSSSNGAMGFLTFLVLVAALGNLTTGIVVLAKQRGRLPGAPVTVLSFASFALLLGSSASPAGTTEPAGSS